MTFFISSCGSGGGEQLAGSSGLDLGRAPADEVTPPEQSPPEPNLGEADNGPDDVIVLPAPEDLRPPAGVEDDGDVAGYDEDVLLGMSGKIVYLTPGEDLSYSGKEELSRVEDFFGPNAREDLLSEVSEKLCMKQLNLPRTRFNQGFQYSNGEALRVPIGEDESEDQELLIEWFGMSLEANLKLAEGEAPGLYQLAVLSDDGSRVILHSLDEAGRFSEKILVGGRVQESVHAPRLACAPQENLLRIEKETRHHIQVEYFQGPRTEIALTLLWRRVPEGQETNEAYLQDPLCGQTRGFFEDFDGTRSEEFKAFFEQGGWEVIPPKNLELRDPANNPCVQERASPEKKEDSEKIRPERPSRDQDLDSEDFRTFSSNQYAQI